MTDKEREKEYDDHAGALLKVHKHVSDAIDHFDHAKDGGVDLADHGPYQRSLAALKAEFEPKGSAVKQSVDKEFAATGRTDPFRI